MGRIGIRRLSGCLAAAGLILAVPWAQATLYYNMTGIDADIQASDYSQSITNTFTTALFNSGPDVTVVGTGVLQPFVRIQQNGNGNCTDPCIESGFNTDGTARFETKDAGDTNWNHSIRLSDVGTSTEGGVTYREFVLDINESLGQDNEFLSLDKFKIWLGATGNLDEYTESPPDGTAVESFTNATKIYDIDDAEDRTIGLNYGLNSGSGRGIDLVVRIPDTLFTLAGVTNPYVYLYSSFGATGRLTGAWDPNGEPPNSTPAGELPRGDYGQSAGFEEWSTRVGRTPEPLTAGLLLIGLAALGLSRRQRLSPSCA